MSPKRIATRNFLRFAFAYDGCVLYVPPASARPFINPSDLFHALPASYAASHPPDPTSKLDRSALWQSAHSALNIQTAIQPLLLFLRKEVIQPHLPIRLPCYDFTPVIRPAFDGSFLSVRSPASGISDSHGVTGGVYKTRERIHRGILIRDY